MGPTETLKPMLHAETPSPNSLLLTFSMYMSTQSRCGSVVLFPQRRGFCQPKGVSRKRGNRRPSRIWKNWPAVFALIANCLAVGWTCAAGENRQEAPSALLPAGYNQDSYALPHANLALESTSLPAPRVGSPEGKIVRILQQMPDWTSFSLNREYPEQRRAIERAMAAISAYDLDTIRAALQYYSRRGWHVDDRSDRVAAYSRELILNKYLFRLPATVRRDSPHFRLFGGGWWNTPISGDRQAPKETDELSIRWPWSEDSSGSWRLTGRYTGYMGDKYQPLTAFDYYRKAFGKRDTRKERVSQAAEAEEEDSGTSEAR